MNEMTTPDMGNFRVLLAEDNDNNRLVAGLILNKLGLTDKIVDFAADGHEAVALIEKNSYDIVFLDIQMPLVDGYEVCERLRGNDDFATPCDIPVVAISAHAHPEFRNRAFLVGMNHFIIKPYTKADIINALERFTPWRNPTQS